MGLYNTVTLPKIIKCKKCGDELDGWQSKDGPCDLQEIDFHQVDNFYTSCDRCGNWIEFCRSKPRPMLPEVPFSDYRLIESNYNY